MKAHFENENIFWKWKHILKMKAHGKQATGVMSLLSKYINCGRVKVWQNTKVVSCISEWHTRLNPPTSTGYHYCYCFYQYTTTTSQMTNLQWSLLLSKSVFLNLMFRLSHFLFFHNFVAKSDQTQKTRNGKNEIINSKIRF